MKKYIVFFIIIYCVLFSSLYAQTLAPGQVEQIKKLSPAQVKELAEQYKVPLPADRKKKHEEFITPQVVEPRSYEDAEPSSIEKEFQDEEIEEQEKDATSDEYKRLKRAFTNFVRETIPSTISTDIKQFGYTLFSGTPSTFAPATDIPVPRDYVIGPGDEVLVHLYGARQEQLSLIVTRDGTINFPDEGPIRVAGLTFSRMTSLIEKIVKNKMIGVNAYITMGQLRSIRVFILGDVEHPGSYMISGLSTLSHALFVSGGIKKIGTLRNIELRRSGKKVATIDLYDFMLKGDTSSDVRLLPGDVVFVPPIGDSAGIAGEIRRPAIYELKGKTTVEELIKMAGGMHATGYKNMAQLERINDKGERILIDLALNDSGNQKILQDGDLLKIFPVLDREENSVYLLGNIKRPGKRAHRPGMTVSDLIGKNEDLLPETFYDYALIKREAEGNREPEFIRFNLGKVFEGDKSADLILKPRDTVYVFNRVHFRETPMVSIEGLIQSPDFYELKKGMRIIDLILASGGLLRDAYMEQAELYRIDPLTDEMRLDRINLDRVLKGDKSDNLLLQDLDKLVIHSVWEFEPAYEVTISGEVNKPGTYPFVEGATISDLIFAGGNFTERAYRKNGELTRYIIIDGEKRESNHFKIDFEALEAGDPNAALKLQPYDHLHIQTITNWRFAEQVSIRGEVRFPGIYPVEDGEKLADLIERAGGFTKDAYLYGARFTRKAIADFQSRQFQEMADRLESDIARASAAPIAVGAEKDVEKQKLAAESLMRLVNKLRRTEPEGRLVIFLKEPEQLRKSEYNIILQDGDALYVPKRPDSILVFGEVYNPSAFLYEKSKKSDEYIKLAGNVTDKADIQAIYVIKANGSVIPNRKIAMDPGDVIIVPEKIKYISALEITKDITQIVYQLGLAAASYHAVGVFE
ncbi:MAG: SLBB domain-containing protein [bacterium]